MRKKSREMLNRSTQTYITNEDFIKISFHQRPMSNEEFLNMFYNKKINNGSNEINSLTIQASEFE